MGSRCRAALLLGLAGAFSVSCGGIIDPSQNQMEPFSGTIAVGQTGPIHFFNASKTGEISVKITALAPSSGVPVGLLWAQASGGVCNGQLLAQTVAQLNIPAISTQIISGSYCIQLGDVGAFSAPETYTVVVSHP